ncbi:hypothetical protein [Pseudomonas protegens]|uniref:hypothetical protein n=1 Tax=Pseudomonas protegens TaxID=380021 RepID=UPI00069F3EC5|nr:hypothetical protein [Pseudomonas protegens]
MDYKEFITKESVLLAALPVVGYIVAIAFEYGYAAYFNYPLSLIVVDLRMTLTSTILGGVYLYSGWFVFEKFVNVARAKSKVSLFLRPMLPFYMFGLLVVLASGFADPYYKFAIYYSIAITVVGGVLVAWNHRKLGLQGALEKLQEEVALSASTTQKPEGVIDFITTYGFIILLGLGMVCGAGRFYAHNKQQWAYFELDSQKYIVVAVYGESVVGVRLKEGDPQDEFAIISKDSEVMQKVKVLGLNSERAKIKKVDVSN